MLVTPSPVGLTIFLAELVKVHDACDGFLSTRCGRPALHGRSKRGRRYEPHRGTCAHPHAMPSASSLGGPGAALRGKSHSTHEGNLVSYSGGEAIIRPGFAEASHPGRNLLNKKVYVTRIVTPAIAGARWRKPSLCRFFPGGKVQLAHYRRAGLLRSSARNMAPRTALWTTNAVAILPTNAAPITIASIVLSSLFEADFSCLEAIVPLPGSCFTEYPPLALITICAFVNRSDLLMVPVLTSAKRSAAPPLYRATANNTGTIPPPAPETPRTK